MLYFCGQNFKYMEINKFKESKIFEMYDNWIQQLLSSELPIISYDEDGNTLDYEPYFREIAAAIEGILSFSSQIYDKIGNCRIFHDYPYGSDHASIVRDMVCCKDYSEEAVLGSVYFMLVYDYPTYPRILGNKHITMRAYNDLFTRIFVSLHSNSIELWLNLYASLRHITSFLELPPRLRTDAAKTYLGKLQAKGLLDNSYKFTPSVRGGAFRHLIAANLRLRTGCKYEDLESHFKLKNLRDKRPLEDFKNRMSEKKEEDSWKIKLYKTIQDIFGYAW